MKDGEGHLGLRRERSDAGLPDQSDLRPDRLSELASLDRRAVGCGQRERSAVRADAQPVSSGPKLLSQSQGLERRLVTRRGLDVEPLPDHHRIEHRVRSKQFDPGVRMEEATGPDRRDVARDRSATLSWRDLQPQAPLGRISHGHIAPRGRRAGQPDDRGRHDPPFVPKHGVEVPPEIEAAGLFLELPVVRSGSMVSRRTRLCGRRHTCVRFWAHERAVPARAVARRRWGQFFVGHARLCIWEEPRSIRSRTLERSRSRKLCATPYIGEVHEFPPRRACDTQDTCSTNNAVPTHETLV
jgi:hypothetical protein